MVSQHFNYRRELVLKDRLEGKWLRFNDEQRRRLAVKAKVYGRRSFDEIEALVTPDTLLVRLKAPPRICLRSVSAQRGVDEWTTRQTSSLWLGRRCNRLDERASWAYHASFTSVSGG